MGNVIIRTEAEWLRFLRDWRFAAEDCYLRTAAAFKQAEDGGEFSIFENDGVLLSGSEALTLWAIDQRHCAEELNNLADKIEDRNRAVPSKMLRGH